MTITFASAAIGNILGIVLRNGDGGWTFGATGFRDIGIVLLSGLAQGLAFGMLLLISAAAIVVYFVVPNLSSLLFGAVPALKDKAHWFDLNQAQGALYHHDMTGRHWAQLLVATLLWVALPAALGVRRVLRAEVTSQ